MNVQQNFLYASPVAAEAVKQPTVAFRPALQFVAIPLAIVCAVLIMGGQVRLGHQQTTLALTTSHCAPPQIGLDLYCDIGIASVVGLTVIFHFIDRRVTPRGLELVDVFRTSSCLVL